MKRRLNWLMGASILLSACSTRVDTVKDRFKSEAFAQSIRSECEVLIDEYHRTERRYWTPASLGDAPTVASLNPKRVKIAEFGGTPGCEIEITDGVRHSGVFYVAASHQDGREVRYGNWRIEQIGQGLYTFQE